MEEGRAGLATEEGRGGHATEEGGGGLLHRKGERGPTRLQYIYELLLIP